MLTLWNENLTKKETSKQTKELSKTESVLAYHKKHLYIIVHVTASFRNIFYTSVFNKIWV